METQLLLQNIGQFCKSRAANCHCGKLEEPLMKMNQEPASHNRDSNTVEINRSWNNDTSVSAAAAPPAPTSTVTSYKAGIVFTDLIFYPRQGGIIHLFDLFAGKLRHR